MGTNVISCANDSSLVIHDTYILKSSNINDVLNHMQKERKLYTTSSNPISIVHARSIQL